MCLDILYFILPPKSIGKHLNCLATALCALYKSCQIKPLTLLHSKGQSKDDWLADILTLLCQGLTIAKQYNRQDGEHQGANLIKVDWFPEYQNPDAYGCGND